MEALVQSFNALPRPQTTPSGILSHWHFSVRNVPIPPSSDLLQIVNPESHFVHNAGPKQILALPTVKARAEAIVPLLLESFVKGLNRGPDGKQLDGLELFAPWTWATSSVELGKAVEKRLVEVGVRSELCTVFTGRKGDDDVADVVWAGFITQLVKSMGGELAPGSGDKVRCGGCKKGSSTFDHPLAKCMGCSKVRYCSKECQKKDWKHHKKVCKKDSESSATTSATPSPASVPEPPVQSQVPVPVPAANSASPTTIVPPDSASAPAKTAPTEPRSMPPHLYWNTAVKNDPKAIELAKSLNLVLGEKGLATPIRRLILTGADTADNYALLLGPAWSRETSLIETTRLEILLNPPLGSPMYAASQEMDASAPLRAPRPAIPGEEEIIKQVREIQKVLRQRMGTRKQLDNGDMMFMIGRFGDRWNQMMPVYTLAINSMDQGVKSR